MALSDGRSFQLPLSKLLQKFSVESDADRNRSKLRIQSQAVIVIKDKIKHYKSTGNERKLSIYEGKLRDKRNVILKLRKLIP